MPDENTGYDFRERSFDADDAESMWEAAFRDGRITREQFQEVRRGWSNHAIVGDHGYATALEKLTGIKADTVRTEYLTEIRGEIGDDPHRPDSTT
ncbi:hypothetical protein [Streptomyces goshikiensis]|uniref:hypothetical protein n=1 Tax=Streptomyces goshikiensis TaxID=1942 RepID=UPI002ADF0098|nr:hypothetical protein [Streptomyces goshikiensis]